MLPILILSAYLVSCTPQIPAIAPNSNITSPSGSSTMSEVILSKVDNSKTITLRRGQMLILRLDENPTTGYRWSSPIMDEQVLQVKSDDLNLPSNTAIGGGGQRIFTFQANNLGQVKLQLKNWREWTGEQSIVDKFEVTIQVVE